MGSVTSDDAKVQGAKMTKDQASLSAALSAPPPEPAVRPRNPNRTGRIHDMVDGAHRSNRTGYQLCADFNAGSCANTVQGSWCGVNNSLVHQCSTCLGTHSLQSCPHKESPKVGWLQNDRSKKGKGKGKKGTGLAGRALTDLRRKVKFHFRMTLCQLQKFQVQVHKMEFEQKQRSHLNRCHTVKPNQNGLSLKTE